jgi:hypothetical protein
MLRMTGRGGYTLENAKSMIAMHRQSLRAGRHGVNGCTDAERLKKFSPQPRRHASRRFRCRTHHRDSYSFGDEVGWWERQAIDPTATSRMLWVRRGASYERSPP